MKRKKLLEWKERNGVKTAVGRRFYFSYYKIGKTFRLILDTDPLASVLECKTERHCLMISNILNQV